MKAMILAAGLGSRLRHKTTDRPKALVEIDGKPIIQYQLSNLIKAGINEIIIATPSRMIGLMITRSPSAVGTDAAECMRSKYQPA